MAALLVYAAGTSPDKYRIVLAALIFVVGAITCKRNLLHGLSLLISWLVFLALVRRLADYYLGNPPSADPFLLVAPALSVFIVFTLSQDRRLQLPRGRIRAVIMGLAALIGLEAVNPLQPSLASGITSLLFVGVPLLYFPIGSALDAHEWQYLVRLASLLGVVVAGYGLLQGVDQVAPWDHFWIQRVSQSLQAINVGNHVRPFSTLSSPGEYGSFLVVALVCCFNASELSRRTRVGISVPLVIALFFSGVRGPLTLALVAGLATMVILNRIRVVTAVFAISALLLILQVLPGLTGSTSNSSIASHQLVGLADPTNAQNSTLGIHYQLVLDGVQQAFTQPIGHGLSSITLAGDRTSPGSSLNTETDPSNLGVACGVLGLTLYCALVTFTLKGLVELADRALKATAAGLLIATSLQWFTGGQYAVAPWAWLAIGLLCARSGPTEAVLDRSGRMRVGDG